MPEALNRQNTNNCSCETVLAQVHRTDSSVSGGKVDEENHACQIQGFARSPVKGNLGGLS